MIKEVTVFVKFPSIDQFRNVCREVSQHFAGRPLPTITFRGTTKIHGTNAAIMFKDGKILFQSRNRSLTVDNDNAGFAEYMTQFTQGGNRDLTLRSLVVQLNERGYHLQTAAKAPIFYGEWCGKGIQKGVAVSEVEKMFVIFAVALVDKETGEPEWVPFDDWKHIEIPEYRIFNITRFGVWEREVDFANAQEAVNGLVALTEEVERECPVGKHFGVSGIGEGVVWTAVHEGRSYRFKVKGAKHSVTKVKKLAAVDVAKLNSIKEFVEHTVTENRLNQAIQYMEEMNLDHKDIRNIGAFLRWLANDVFKEESDTMEKSGLEKKDISKYIADVGKQWYLKRMQDIAA